MAYFCSISENCLFTADAPLIITKHLQSVHNISDKGQAIKCIASRDCNVIRNTLTSLRAHANSHFNFNSNQSVPVYKELTSTTSMNCVAPVSVKPTGIDKEKHVHLEAGYRSSSKAFLHNLSASGVCESLCSEIKEFVCNSLCTMADIVKCNIKGDESAHVIDTIAGRMKEPLRELGSVYLRKKSIQNEHMFVAPQTIGISLETDMKKNFKLNEEASSTTDFQYISICETLQKLLSLRFYREAYINSVSYEKGVFKHATCGSYFRDGPFSNLVLLENEFPPALIQIYSDALEINEGRHKESSLTAFYMSVRNIDDIYMSQHRNIHLVGLCRTSDINNEIRGKGKDLNKIQNVITQDLLKLESGIPVTYDENGILVTKTLKGSLFTGVNDNKGHSEMFGLVESTNATYFCRFDLMTREESKTCTNIKKIRGLKRPSGGLEYYRPFIEAKTKTDYKETKGIALVCSFATLTFVSIVDAMSVDIFHDFMEGLIPIILRRFFELLIRHSIFGLDEINSIVLGYDYGVSDRPHRPSVINLESTTLGQGGVQLLNLFIRIPFMFDTLRSDKRVNPLLCLFSQLIRILQIASSTTITERMLIELECLTKIFLDKSKDGLGKWDPVTKKITKFKLTPKAHWLLHYPDVVRMLGPLFPLSTMRYEAKHPFFKKLCRLISNQNDLLHFLAIKHQEWWTMQWSQSQNMNEIDGSKEYDIDEFDVLPHQNGLWKKLTFLKYFFVLHPGYFVSVEKTIGDPMFYKIAKIYSNTNGNEKKYYLQCISINTTFDEFYNGYEINNESSHFTYIDIETMKNTEAYEKWKSKSSFSKEYLFCKKNCVYLK